MTKKTHEHRLQKAVKLARTIYDHRIFRFIISGGVSTVVDIGVFGILYNFVFHKQNVHPFGFAMNAYSAALVISYSCGAVTSFTINKFFVFNDKKSWKEQLARFIPVNFLGFIGNFFLLKSFIALFNIWPTLARGLAALIVAFVTYNLHKSFTFRSTKNEHGHTL